MTNYLPDRDSGSSYGALNKLNSQNLPPSNLQTDWDNTTLAPAICNIAGLTQVSPRFVCRVKLATSTGGMSILSWYSVWNGATGTNPVASRSSTGSYTITLPTTVSDEYNASFNVVGNHTVALLGATGASEGTTYCSLQCSAVGNVITVNSFNSSNVLSDSTSIALIVAY